VNNVLPRKGYCGFNCECCPYYLKLCRGCVSKACLIAQCQRGIQYTGITSPRPFCRLKEYCPIKNKTRTPAQLPTLNKKSMAKINFQRFVPEIDIADKRSWFWNYGIELPEIFVPLWQILVNKGVIEKASRGLHDYLGFNGRIFLSLVMPDELIDKLKIEDYFNLIKDLRPDATMTPDNYTYIDDPLFLSWSQTIHLVSFANYFLKLDIPLIGLVKGANLLQMDYVIRKQTKMGYSSFAMPSRELLEEDMLNDFLPGVLWSLKRNSKVAKTSFELLVYGVGRKLRYKGLSYSNLSWFIEAKQGFYFKDGFFYDLRDPSIRFEECYCEACNGMMPQEIIDLMFENEEEGFRKLTLHNLLSMNKILAR